MPARSGWELASPEAGSPAPWCYWVLPGRLLAGCYPGARDPEERRRKRELLAAAGIRTFLNLMEPDERDARGRPFLPYLFETDEGALRMVRIPIRDRDVPGPETMVRILDTLDEFLARDGAVYVHCWGGVGRTGTVVGCWLLRHRLATLASVLDTLAALRAADRIRGGRTSPETEAQKRFLLGWPEGG